ncbi:MAG TPA: polysaccharide biosynthesis tyrosine autokinase [Acidimicrobiales bacterium]|nr:polysaccharide biosynthesis tyrosine autokinase [Acidimicrobiales bacterium]
MVPQEASSELELRDYLQVLRRRRWIVALATLIVVGAALTSSLLQTPVYRASAELLLQARSTESLFDPNSGVRNDPVRAVQTEIQVLKSQPVRDAVRRQLGVAPKVSASPIGQTDVIAVKAESTDPRRAAAVANAYSKAYIDFRRTQAVNDLFAAAKEIQVKVDDLQGQIDALPAPSTDPRERANAAADAAATEARRTSLLQQQALFKQRLDQLQVDAALKTGGAQLVTEASVPSDPVKPTPKRTGVVALAVGLMFGVVLAFLFEYLDDTIKSKEDLGRATGDIPTIGLIPAVGSWKDRGEPMVVSLTDPKSPVAEAYRSLRTSIQFIGLDRPMRTIQVTSPGASEGKSTTIANLAVALAQAGQRVVIVCCDLRRPRIHDFFGMSNTVGFTSVLLGDTPLSAAIQKVRGQERLAVLASGPIPPNPSELLSGRRTVEVLTAVQAEADIVLVDCPPVLPVTDAAVLSSRVDATLLVATAGETTRKEMARTIELLSHVDAPILGTVLNGAGDEDSYGYPYRYSYSPTPAGSRSDKNKVKARAKKDRAAQAKV